MNEKLMYLFQLSLSTLQKHVNYFFHNLYVYCKSFIKYCKIYKESNSKLIFIAECSMKNQSNLIQNLFKICLKNHNSLFYPIKLVCFIPIKVRERKSGLPEYECITSALAFTIFQDFFFYMTSQKLHYLLN